MLLAHFSEYSCFLTYFDQYFGKKSTYLRHPASVWVMVTTVLQDSGHDPELRLNSIQQKYPLLRKSDTSPNLEGTYYTKTPFTQTGFYSSSCSLHLFCILKIQKGILDHSISHDFGTRERLAGINQLDTFYSSTIPRYPWQRFISQM